MKILDWLFPKRNKNNENEKAEAPELAAILLKLETLKKQTFVPIVQDGDGDISASKFSGHPQISGSHPWPMCPSCSNNMQLFWQQDLAESDLKHSYPLKEGLLQSFYCVSDEPLCEVECESYAPFSKATHFRVVAKGEGQTEVSPKEYFPAKRIVGWTTQDDYPGYEELEETGIKLTDDEYEVYLDSYPVQGDKIGGWPFWVQNVEYPDCPKCSSRMEFLIQVDSEENLPHMFGDSGAGHLTFCKNHPEVMSFHWACY